MSDSFTAQSSLENLKKEAKRWLKAIRARDQQATARLRRVYPDVPAEPGLRDIQHALALENGLPGWTALKRLHAAASESTQTALRQYEEKAEALLEAFQTGAPTAMERHWSLTWHRRAWQGMRTYVLLDLGRQDDPANPDTTITLDDAKYLVAREHGFDNWQALAQYAAAKKPASIPAAAKPVTLQSIDEEGATQPVERLRDWDAVLSRMQEKWIPALNAEGQMTDEVLELLSRLDHITALDLHGSKQLTDAGLKHLSRLPRLQRLNLSGCDITDKGLEVLRGLHELKTIHLASTSLTDAGIAHLADCDDLEQVNLAWTQTGDGALKALAGKSGLCWFMSGANVTDAGIPLLHEYPVFKTWQGGDARMSLLDFDAGPNYLGLRGSITDAGAARLAGLAGLFALNLDDSNLAVTAAGLAPLASLPHLGWLSFDATDDAMPYIAAMPKVRFLMCQDTQAGDNGWVALSRSQSIEHIWGRRCYNLGSRGFSALAAMPALRALSVSCKNVDDAALSNLPRFPALRELMPMDVPDEGYRHIGRCENLESLILMYCRETTDASTEHIVGLPRLRKYFASYNRITDRTPELLSGIASLEQVEFAGCAGLTDTGIMALARLPRLRELRVSGIPNVTPAIPAAFSPGVRMEMNA